METAATYLRKLPKTRHCCRYLSLLAISHAFAYRSLLGFDPLSAKNRM
jgi:hypothetical protein